MRLYDRYEIVDRSDGDDDPMLYINIPSADGAKPDSDVPDDVTDAEWKGVRYALSMLADGLDPEERNSDALA